MLDALGAYVTLEILSIPVVKTSSSHHLMTFGDGSMCCLECYYAAADIEEWEGGALFIMILVNALQNQRHIELQLKKSWQYRQSITFIKGSHHR